MMQLQNWLSGVNSDLVFFTFNMDCDGREVKVTTDVEPTKAYEAEMLTHIRSIENALATESFNLDTDNT